MANVPISGFTVPANTVGIGATGYSLTGSANASFVDLAGTWNTTGTPTLIKANVTDTASNAASLLMDLQVGGTSVFRFGKDGNAYVLGGGNKGFYGYGVSTNGGYAINGSAVIVAENGRFTTNASIRFGSNTAQVQWVDDLFLTRKGAANLRLGAADAAAPVAQTLSVQGVVAGTTNTAGANLTIAGSQGTGTGAGGSIVFQVAPAGASGTAQNALATALTIDSTQKLTIADGSFSAASLGFSSNSASTGFYRAPTNGFGWSVNGNAWFTVTQTSVSIVRDTVPFTLGAASDVQIHRDAANTLALRNGTNAQEMRWYRTFTDASNYQRGALKTAASEIIIEAQTAGTGADDIDVTLTPAGTGNVRFGTHTGTVDTAVSGYIEIKDAGGTIRKLAVIT